jgi:hypothetical protein
MTPALINLISCAFALLAAGFWLWSAATRFPELRGRHKTVLEDMQLRSQTLRHQSRPQRGRRGFRRRRGRLPTNRYHRGARGLKARGRPSNATIAPRSTRRAMLT